jgi:protein-S-isoprenylcysteine O-methyltransferase Ste14
MKVPAQLGRLGTLVVLGIAAAEVLIMISPFAAFFYATLRFEPLLGSLSRTPATAWLDGFFLNHALITTSRLLEWHRKAGVALIVLGLAGFLISAVQVYGNKVRKRGVATGLLYRLVRHPQYLCLGVAGWGLLTLWPRFLLLGTWVTMLFLYAALARVEERQMTERFGAAYREFAAARGAFLPGSPARRVFEATFGRLRPRALGWIAAYGTCLGLAFSLGFGLRAYTRASVAIRWEPEDRAVVVSVWPKRQEWMARVYQGALSEEAVRDRLHEAQGPHPVVVTILPRGYGMKGMYYTLPAGDHMDRPDGLMGVDPERTGEPVEVVFSRAKKPYRPTLSVDEALDVDVRLTPLVVVDVDHRGGEATRVRTALPQNAWGPGVVMPIF